MVHGYKLFFQQALEIPMEMELLMLLLFWQFENQKKLHPTSQIALTNSVLVDVARETSVDI